MKQLVIPVKSNLESAWEKCVQEKWAEEGKGVECWCNSREDEGRDFIAFTTRRATPSSTTAPIGTVGTAMTKLAGSSATANVDANANSVSGTASSTIIFTTTEASSSPSVSSPTNPSSTLTSISNVINLGNFSSKMSFDKVAGARVAIEAKIPNLTVNCKTPPVTRTTKKTIHKTPLPPKRNMARKGWEGSNRWGWIHAGTLKHIWQIVMVFALPKVGGRPNTDEALLLNCGTSIPCFCCTSRPGIKSYSMPSSWKWLCGRIWILPYWHTFLVRRGSVWKIT